MLAIATLVGCLVHRVLWVRVDLNKYLLYLGLKIGSMLLVKREFLLVTQLALATKKLWWYGNSTKLIPSGTLLPNQVDNSWDVVIQENKHYIKTIAEVLLPGPEEGKLSWSGH